MTGTTTYAYDPAGNLMTTTDANGATTTRTYDALNRVLTASSTCSGADTETVTWAYDDATPGRYGIGRVATMIDPSGSTSYAYERRGFLREENRVIDSWASATEYRYDAAGRRVQMGDLEYGYDFAGRQDSVARRACPSCTPVTLVSSASYLPFGPLSSLTYGNGTMQTMAYDARYRLDENRLSAGAVTLADFAYDHDSANNITAIHDSTDATFDRAFAYDDLNRLTSATTGTSLWGTGSYVYDAMGNVISLAVGDRAESFTYVGNTPLVATSTSQGHTFSVAYDAAGNELSSGTTLTPSDGDVLLADTAILAHTYSCRNLLQTAIESPQLDCDGRPCPPPDGSVIRYAYDGRDLRVHAATESGPFGFTTPKSEYVYTPELQLALRYDVTLDSEDEFVWFDGRPVAQISTYASGPLYTFADHLGTPIVQTDSSGAIVWQAEYEPYGRIYAMRADTSGVPQILRLPGQEVSDHAPEENYNVFRWYRPGWGRYTQGDPFAHPTWWEPSVYAYVRQNPLRWSDSLGLYTVDGSCYTCGPPTFGRVGADVTRMCQNTQRPACRQITRALSLIPAANGGQSLPLESCLSRRCANSTVTVQCAVNTAPVRDPLNGACGQASPNDGTITLLRGNSTMYQGPGTRACPFERGLSWVPTLFEEAVHGCGLWQEPYKNDQLSAIFRKMMEKCADYGPANY